jgi:hypothetical protein
MRISTLYFTDFPKFAYNTVTYLRGSQSRGLFSGNQLERQKNVFANRQVANFSSSRVRFELQEVRHRLEQTSSLINDLEKNKKHREIKALNQNLRTMLELLSPNFEDIEALNKGYYLKVFQEALNKAEQGLEKYNDGALVEIKDRLEYIIKVLNKEISFEKENVLKLDIGRWAAQVDEFNRELGSYFHKVSGQLEKLQQEIAKQ